jgi:hypothetical protein
MSSARAQAQAKATQNCFIQQYISDLKKKSRPDIGYNIGPIVRGQHPPIYNGRQNNGSKVKIIKHAELMNYFLNNESRNSGDKKSSRSKTNGNPKVPSLGNLEHEIQTEYLDPKEIKEQDVQSVLTELNNRRLQLREELRQIDRLERKILQERNINQRNESQKSPRNSPRIQSPRSENSKESPRRASQKEKNKQQQKVAPRVLSDESPIPKLSPQMQNFFVESKKSHHDTSEEHDDFQVNNDSSSSSDSESDKELEPKEIEDKIDRIAELYAESPPRSMRKSPRVYQLSKRELESPRGERKVLNEDELNRQGSKPRQQKVIEWQHEVASNKATMSTVSKENESTLPADSDSDSISSSDGTTSDDSSYNSDEFKPKFEIQRQKGHRISTPPPTDSAHSSPQEKKRLPKQYVIDRKIMEQMVDNGFDNAVGKLQNSFGSLSAMSTQRVAAESKQQQTKTMYDNMSRGLGTRGQKLSPHHFSRKY